MRGFWGAFLGFIAGYTVYQFLTALIGDKATQWGSQLRNWILCAVKYEWPDRTE